jgi:hypothetical protein
MRFIMPSSVLIGLCYLWGSLVQADIGAWSPSSISLSSNVLESSPTEANIIYAGTQTGGLFQRDLSIVDSQWKPMDTATVYAPTPSFTSLLINTIDGNGIAGTVKQGLFVGSASTQLWENVLASPNDAITDLLLDNSTALPRFYAALGKSFVLSSTDGKIWTDRSLGLDNLQIHRLAASDRAIYAATNQGIFKSSDEGLTWVATNNILRFRDISDLQAATPNISSPIYAAAPNYGVFRTLNAGATWQTINAGLTELSVKHIQVHPQNPNVVLLNTDNNVYLTTTGGFQWQQQSVGLSNITINDLLLENRRELRAHAATEAGIYEIDFNTLVESFTVNQAPVNTMPSQLPDLIINKAFAINGLQVSDAEAGGQAIEVRLEVSNGRLDFDQNLNFSNLEIILNANVLRIVGNQEIINVLLSSVKIIPDTLGAASLQMRSNDLGSGSTLAAW